MKESLSRSKLNTTAELVAFSHISDTDTEDFSINCSFRTVRVEASVCLLSRINYCFPGSACISVHSAMRYASALNALLSQSKVYVVKDIDGDRGYFLEIDSVLKGEATSSTINAFLVGVTQDIETVLKYFQKEIDKSQPTCLSAVAQGCNVTSLKTKVRMVA